MLMFFELINVNQIKKRLYLGREIEYTKAINIKFCTSKIEHVINDRMCLDAGGEYLYLELTPSLESLLNSVDWEELGTIRVFTIEGVSRLVKKSILLVEDFTEHEDDWGGSDYLGEGWNY
ncbi:hypothetical protein HC864_02140 [Candidatus Gracilibacteria bacterium]|nr:hypothetical protein [Candidatus Gracilibacteria bacterium]